MNLKNLLQLITKRLNYQKYADVNLKVGIYLLTWNNLSNISALFKLLRWSLQSYILPLKFLLDQQLDSITPNNILPFSEDRKILNYYENIVLN